MGIIIIAIVFFIISFAVSQRLKSKFKKYAQVSLASGISGKEIARKMLDDNGIYDVKIESTEGRLTDHYNPYDKTINLSKDVYNGRNAAAAAVAAHETGHALQHAQAYSMLKVRSALVPVQNLSAKIMNFLMMFMLFGGMFLYQSFPIQPILLVIVLANLVFTLFAFVTLPVEFDASKRALAWIDQKGIVNSKEHGMAKDALNWAAMTYVVAALGALAQLLYWASLLLGGDE